ncbi:hypothetical protein ACVIGB_000653 [Bradyrhizobium sp. USDA 4341]
MRPDKTILLMPCSGKKLDHADQPRRLYTGPMWQTLRTHRGELPWRNVFVLSGRFGFVTAETFIQTYNERLTREKADYLIRGGIRAPNNHYGKASPGGPGPADVVRPYAYKDRRPFETVISAGAGEYRRVFEAFIPQFIADDIIASDAKVLQVAGGIGEQRAQLGRWLRGLSK